MSFSSVLTALLDANSGYYKLAEASGTTMGDSSGNSHDGTYSGTITLGQTGLISGESETCALFGGGVGEVAQAAWMDQAHAGVGILLTHGATINRYLIGRFHNGTDQYLSIDIGSSTTLLRCYAYINSVQRLISATATNIADGNMHFVYASYDGTTLALYYDGSLLTSGTWSGSLTASTASLRIGARGDGSETWNAKLEKGWIGPVLTSTQVAALWSAATGSATTISGAAAITETSSVTVTGRTTARVAAAITESTSVGVGVRLDQHAAAAITEQSSVIVTAGAIIEATPTITEQSSVTVRGLASRVGAVSITELSSVVASASLGQMAVLAIDEATSVSVSVASEVAAAMTTLTSVGFAAVVVSIGPVDDNLNNAGALMPGGWSTTSYDIDPPSSTGRRDIPAVHYEPA